MNLFDFLASDLIYFILFIHKKGVKNVSTRIPIQEVSVHILVSFSYQNTLQ